jgi:DNA-binding response OmpR family regulator
LKVLIADDDRTSLHLLGADLRKWGHDVLAVGDGAAAWEALQSEVAPELAIVDWMMPGLDGVEICRRARARSSAPILYVILLTSRAEPEDLVRALGAGADDYVRKPFDPAELRARVEVGVRVVRLQGELARRIRELEEALARVDELHGILPVCSYCKKVRSDADSWHRMEDYVTAHSSARFSHGVCPSCVEAVLKPEMEAWRHKNETPARRGDKP